MNEENTRYLSRTLMNIMPLHHTRLPIPPTLVTSASSCSPLLQTERLSDQRVWPVESGEQRRLRKRHVEDGFKRNQVNNTWHETSASCTARQHTNQSCWITIPAKEINPALCCPLPLPVPQLPPPSFLSPLSPLRLTQLAPLPASLSQCVLPCP